MKYCRIFLLGFLAVVSPSFGQEEDEDDFNPYTGFISSIQNTKLISVDVDIWDEDESQDAVWASREQSLERKIREKLRKHGMVENVYHELKQLPDYQQFQTFYDDQFDNAALLNINIYKKNTRLFVEMSCWKNSVERKDNVEIQTQVPLYARTFIIDDEGEEEAEGEGWWWVTINDKILSRVDEFLKTFCQINPGPYGWVRP